MIRTLFAGLFVLALFAPATVWAQTGAAIEPVQDAVLARVNGDTVRRTEVLAAIEELPAQYRQMPMEVLFDRMISQLIDRKLVAQAAQKGGLGGDPEVERRLAGLRERLMQEVYLTRAIEERVTDEKVRARYDTEVRDLPVREEVRARHILVDQESEAKAVLDELAKGGDFIAIARRLTPGPAGAANDGGDLGYFTKDRMVPEFAEAAFALKKGETSKAPVKTQFGWHIIKVEDRRATPPPSFDERKPELQRILADEGLRAVLEDLRKGAKIERTVLPAENGVKKP
jgi:peptidyl-prolyl cis-trans isomerase C